MHRFQRKTFQSTLLTQNLGEKRSQHEEYNDSNNEHTFWLTFFALLGMPSTEIGTDDQSSSNTPLTAFHLETISRRSVFWKFSRSSSILCWSTLAAPVTNWTCESLSARYLNHPFDWNGSSMSRTSLQMNSAVGPLTMRHSFQRYGVPWANTSFDGFLSALSTTPESLETTCRMAEAPVADLGARGAGVAGGSVEEDGVDGSGSAIWKRRGDVQLFQTKLREN